MLKQYFYSLSFFVPLTGWSISLNGAESQPLPAIEIEGMSATYVDNSTPILIRITQGSEFTRYHLAYYSTDDTLEGTDREGKRRLLEKVVSYAAIVKGDADGYQSSVLIQEHVSGYSVLFRFLSLDLIDERSKKDVSIDKDQLMEQYIIDNKNVSFKKVPTKDVIGWQKECITEDPIIFLQYKKIHIINDEEVEIKMTRMKEEEQKKDDQEFIDLLKDNIEELILHAPMPSPLPSPLPSRAKDRRQSSADPDFVKPVILLVVLGIGGVLGYLHEKKSNEEKSQERKKAESDILAI